MPSQQTDGPDKGVPTLSPQRVVHVQQRHNWDCGLACSVMVLQALRVHHATVSDVYAQVSAKAVWTIQLAHIMRRYGCDVLFTTLVIGANPAYASEPFYRRQFAADHAFVNTLFSAAANAGITVQKRALPWQELRDCVQHHGLVIVLVDKWKLREGATFCCGLVEPSYAGHYVVLSAFDSATCEFTVNDPACAVRMATLTPTQLDRARRVHGTDEDVLIVRRRKPAESMDSEHSCADNHAE